MRSAMNSFNNGHGKCWRIWAVNLGLSHSKWGPTTTAVCSRRNVMGVRIPPILASGIRSGNFAYHGIPLHLGKLNSIASLHYIGDNGVGFW